MIQQDRMYSPLLNPLYEGCDMNDLCVGTYLIGAAKEEEAIVKAASIGIEQTTGSWVDVPEETDEVRAKYCSKIIGIYEVPAFENQTNVNRQVAPDGLRFYVVRIGFPVANIEDNIPLLIASITGNIMSMPYLKLLDIDFPKKFADKFQGPKFGIDGIRKVLDVYDRPLLNNMIKPCTGLDPKMTAKLAYEAAVGGVDIIKDDELVANPPHCPLEERVKAVMPAIKQADKEKGEKTLYAFNITDRTENLKKNALTVIENGGNCLLLNYNSVGLDACRMIAEDPDINVPILAHSDYTGAVYESPWSGVSLNLIGAVFPRMAGMDMVIALSPYGKFPMMEDAFINAGYKMIQPFGHIKPIMPMPGGGTTQGHIQDLIEKFGTDVMIAAGGAIHGHPMGAIAGAKAFRQGIDAVMSGKTLRQASEEYAELKAAVDAWGIYGEDQGKIFDLKG